MKTFSSFGREVARLQKQLLTELRDSVTLAMIDEDMRRCDVARKMSRSAAFICQLLGTETNITLASAVGLALAVKRRIRITLERID